MSLPIFVMLALGAKALEKSAPVIQSGVDDLKRKLDARRTDREERKARVHAEVMTAIDAVLAEEDFEKELELERKLLEVEKLRLEVKAAKRAQESIEAEEDFDPDDCDPNLCL